MSVVKDFAAAFNQRDVDRLVACFTAEATYVDNFYGAHTGAAALRAMFERMFREWRDYVWTMERVIETDEAAAAEWSFTYVATDAVPRSAGRRVRLHGMSFFELRGRRIVAYCEAFDTGLALLQLGFTPEAIAKVLRRRLP